MQIVLTGHMDVPPDRIDAVMAALPDHIALTRAEPGCLSFEVKPAPGLPGRLVVSERFQSRADFEAHQARIKGSHWAAVTRGIARHYKVSEVPA
ncbi:putative quinol monooxygenase [Ruegeria marisrubri]|nr:putative quinol monooxygenase [Ruegeria marisrubri]